MPPKPAPAKIWNELEGRLAQSLFPQVPHPGVYLQTLSRYYYSGQISPAFYASASVLLQNFNFLSEIIAGEYAVDHLSGVWVERHIGLFMEEVVESGLSIVGALNGLAIISANRGRIEVLKFLRKLPQWSELNQEEMLIAALSHGQITVGQWVLDQEGILFGDEDKKEAATVFRQVIGERPTRNHVIEIFEKCERRGCFNRKANKYSRNAISKDFVAFLALTHEKCHESFTKKSEYDFFSTATSNFYESLNFVPSDFGKYLIIYSLQANGEREAGRLEKIVKHPPIKSLTKDEFIEFAMLVPWFSESLSPYTTKCLELLSRTNPEIDHHEILKAFFLQSRKHIEDVFYSVDNVKQWCGYFGRMIDQIYSLWPNTKKTIDRNFIAEKALISLKKQQKKESDEGAVMHFESYLNDFKNGIMLPPRSKQRL